ncbi:WD40 repeat domain-containing protein [Streptomyces sp. NPDC001083]|uniref:WD40 repeat domain-containing protein n=1 Tax=Streptomyces sp. NPDC001083 TaxID=3364545 RepID=UPI0036A24979
MARTPWGRRRIDRRLREHWQRATGHKDWGDDRIGTLLEGLRLSYPSDLEVRRLAAIPPGVELLATEVEEAWNQPDSPFRHVHITLGLLESLNHVGLVHITKDDDGRGWLTVPEELHERLRSRWSASEEADWHEQLVHNAFLLLKPGDPWWSLPAGAGYWWRHLVWHLRYCDPAQAAALVTFPGWQIAKIQRLGAQSLLADLALVDSPESRETASVINEVMGGQEHGSQLDPGKRAELLRALSPGPAPLPRADADHHAGRRRSAVAGQPGGRQLAAVRGVLQLPRSTFGFALSPDGTWLVAVGDGGLVNVYDVETQDLRRMIRSPHDRLHNCAVSPDGSFIMTSAVGEKAQAWDAVSGEERLPFKVGTVGESVYGPDGMWVAYNSFTGSFVDPLTNERRGTKPTSKGMSHLALAADGSTLATRGRGRQVLLWDPRSGRLLAELPDQPHSVHRIGLAGDGSWIAFGGQYDLRVLELPSNRERFTLEQNGTRFATTEEWLAVPAAKRVQIRSTRTGELLDTLEAHTDVVLDCRASPDREHLMTFDRSGTLIVWDAAAIVP